MEEKLICKICNKKFESILSISLHLKIHKINKKKYYDKYLRKEKEGICSVCNKETSFIGLNPGYSKRCSLKCLHNDKEVKEKKMQTCKLHYGTEFPLQNKEIRRKTKQTCLKKLGVENPNQNENVKLKKIETYKKNWGVEHSMKCKEGRIKGEQTLLKRYSTTNISQIEGVAEKKIQTSIKNWGVESPNQSEIVKSKKIKTWIENLGVENPSQNKKVKERKRETLLEHFGTTNTYDLPHHPRTKKYKDTSLIYQGSYEKYFLEQIESVNLLNRVKRGPTLRYVWKEKEYIYYPDFILDNTVIEVKSTWTYNKHGKDKELQKLNETKWSAAINSNYKFVALLSKKEIDSFITELLTSNN